MLGALALVLACWFVSRHFYSPTTDFHAHYEQGAAAIIEQILAALLIPAAFICEFSGFGSGSPGEVVVLCALLWPAFLLCFRSFSSLPPAGRIVFIAYSVIFFATVALLFISLHRSWHRFFPG